MRLFSLLLALIVSSLADAEDVFSSVRQISMEVPDSFKGKTLWELGLIEKLEVEYERGGYVADQEDLFLVLREHRITSRASLETSLASDLPPFVKVTFADGTKVSTDRYEAVISPPDGQPFFCILQPREEPAKPRVFVVLCGKSQNLSSYEH